MSASKAAAVEGTHTETDVPGAVDALTSVWLALPCVHRLHCKLSVPCLGQIICLCEGIYCLQSACKKDWLAVMPDLLTALSYAGIAASLHSIPTTGHHNLLAG